MLNRGLLAVLCGLGLLLGSGGVKAQPLVPGPDLALSEIFGSFPRRVELGDANGDGNLDILTDQNVIFLADGTGSYDPVRISANRAIAFADLNDDGFDDIIAATFSGLVVLLGAADNQFDPGPSSGLSLTDFPVTVEIGDFDGDSDQDIAVVLGAGGIEVFLNDGSGALAPAAGVQFEAENMRLSTSGDINADGIDDIAVVDPFLNPNQIQIFLGNGSGGFSEAPGSPVSFSGRSDTIAFHDMTDDGQRDLLVLGGAVAVYAGDGSGAFSEIDASPFPFSSGDIAEFLDIGDMNSDGTPDVVAANRVRSVSVMANAGDGSLAEIAESPFPAGDQAGFVSLGDLDNDGNLDAVTANNVSNDLSILLGDGTGVLAPAAASPIVLDAVVNSPMLRDMNGDSLPDLMFLRESQDEFVFAPGEGDGIFGGFTSIQASDRPTSFAIGDLNDDSNLDVLFGLREANDRPPDTENGDIAVLLGDGAGGFTKIPQAGLPEDSGTIDVAITEFDGSAPPDIFVRNGSGIRLFSGNGDGTFSDFGFVEFSGSSIAIDVLSLDIDGDGILDIVTSFQRNEELSVFLGSGDGTFTEAPFSPVFVTPGGLNQIISADFDDDGLPDLATGNSDGSVSLLLNEGGSGFDISEIVPTEFNSARISSGDFDADGNPDILFAQGSSYDFLLGDGAGGFSPGTGGSQIAAGRILGFSVAMLDGDSADDAIFLQRAGGFPQFYNLQTLLSTTVELQTDRTQVDFGQVELGSTSAPESILISSTGERSLEIESISIAGNDPGQFSIDQDECSGQQISPGTDCSVTVVFEPLDAGNQSARLEVLSNVSSSPDTIELMGESIVVNQPFLSLQPASVDFGDVAIGDLRNRFSVIENLGDEPLEIGELILTADTGYSLIEDNCSNETVQAGNSCSYVVVFEPTATGSRDAVVEIVSNAPSTPDQQSYTANAVEAPVITFVPGGFDFGQVQVGSTSQSGELLVENSGSAELVINFIELQGIDADDFELTVDECSGQTVLVGESCAFELSFTPADVGFQGPAVAVDSNLSFRRFFLIQGEGISASAPELDLMPNTIDFGNMPTGDASASVSLTFSNPGVGPLEVTGVGPAEGSFVRAGGSCGAEPFSVAAGGSCTIDYRFQPVDPGSFSQTIAVESDAIAGSDTEFMLAGTSGQFDVAVLKTNAAEFVLSGVATVYDIQLLNLGLSDLFGVEVVDILPPELDVAAATWTCTPGTGVTCPVGSGSGDIDELVDLPAGAGMTFTLTAPVLAPEGVDVVNTVTATLPSGLADEAPSNNSATDSDPVAVFAADFEFAGCGADLIETRFCVVGENVVLDTVTGLEWRRCSEGRTWDEPTQTCVGDPAGFDWAAASSLAPSGSWRLPTVEELATLRYCSDGDPALFLPSVSGPGIRCSNPGSVVQPVIEPNAFPDMPLNAPAGPPWFWTSTDGDDTIDDSSLAVSFGEGNILNVTVGTSLRVLLVR